jgi:hypothetical protein
MSYCTYCGCPIPLLLSPKGLANTAEIYNHRAICKEYQARGIMPTVSRLNAK